jgi:hypothetical protein
MGATARRLKKSVSSPEAVRWCIIRETPSNTSRYVTIASIVWRRFGGNLVSEMTLGVNH